MKKMEKETHVMGFGRFIVRNKPVRKVGIDTNLILPWIQNEDYSGRYKPNFCNKENKLFINYKIFGELMGLLINENKNPQEIRKRIFRFLRENKIVLLKKKAINLKELEKVYNDLKNKFKDIKESDLLITAIFYCFNIDCIFSADEEHFREPCSFLGINYEKHIEIEIGSEQDVKRMLKDIYSRQHKKRKK
jgi:predicted nucleic-acid-binding protein